MRRFSAPLRALSKVTPLVIALVTLCLALPAAAQDDDWDDWDDDESEDGGSAFGEYWSNVVNRLGVGANSVATFPADPVMGTVTPLEEFDDLPAGVVTKYPVGLVQGTLLSTYRGAMGTLDMLFAVITPFKMLSPEPRYLVIPGLEHEEY